MHELLLAHPGTPQWIAVFDRVCNQLSYFEHPLQIMVGRRSMMRRIMRNRGILWKGYTTNPNDWEWTWRHWMQLM
ncbi:MAG: hypothetical protein DMG72_24385 [Acidobacteria bacterium]|nr:MAG: hypothetical protein DMG72_24385 [Acidobacteriota bacterium]